MRQLKSSSKALEVMNEVGNLFAAYINMSISNISEWTVMIQAGSQLFKKYPKYSLY
jgi:hypothetical protein